MCARYSNLLKERVAEYTPEKVGEICGIKPGLVRRLANEIGAAKRMRNIGQTTFSKCYHGNLAERAQILIFALTGNIGRKGAGYSGFPMLANEGIDTFRAGPHGGGSERHAGNGSDDRAAPGRRRNPRNDHL